MNYLSLKFKDENLEKKYFEWSYSRDFAILKVFIGAMILFVDIPSIIISFYNGENEIAIGWVVLLIALTSSILMIRFVPQSYNYLISLFHIFLLFINYYYIYHKDSQHLTLKYGKNILFIYAASQGTFHCAILSLGTEFLMSSLSMMTAYIVYSFLFFEGFTTFHIGLLYIGTFTMYSKYIRDKSSREMFLLRERENKWLTIIQKALPTNILLVSYDDKFDKVKVDLVNQKAKNTFKFENENSWSEFSNSMMIERTSAKDLLPINQFQSERMIGHSSNVQKNVCSLHQYISSSFRDSAKQKDKKDNKSLASQNGTLKLPPRQNCILKDLQVLNESQLNSMSMISKTFSQNLDIQKQIHSPGLKQLTKKKIQKISELSVSLPVDNFIGTFKLEDQQDIKYRIKTIKYKIQQQYCLIVIEEESDQEKMQALRKSYSIFDQITSKFFLNTGQRLQRVTDEFKQKKLKELILKQNPFAIQTLKYETSIIYNNIYNIRTHLFFSRSLKNKIQANISNFNIVQTLQDICNTFQGNKKIQQRVLKLLLSTSGLVNSTEDQLIEDVCIISDLQLFQQLIFTLLQNAIEYTQKGYVVLKVQTIPGQNQFSTVYRFDISDSGVGFDFQIQQINDLLGVSNLQEIGLKFIFSTGSFGMRNSNRIVQALGPLSKMFVISHKGKGSRIIFYLYQDMKVLNKGNYNVQFSNLSFAVNSQQLQQSIEIGEGKLPKLLIEQQSFQGSVLIKGSTSFLGFEDISYINEQELDEGNNDNVKNSSIQFNIRDKNQSLLFSPVNEQFTKEQTFLFNPTESKHIQ